MGEVKVPIDAYYGAQTQRSIENFKIARDTDRMPIEIIRAFAYLKKAAALANQKAGVLPEDKASLIGKVCDEILEGKLDDSFPLVVWQTGSGTQSNMNVNEVIAYRGHVLKGGSLSDKEKYLHPNDDVNKSQSSNDTFPTAMHIAAYKMLLEVTIPGIEKLRDTLQEKSTAYMKVVKIGRTHFMDATPLTLGQEISGYVSQLSHGLKAINNSLSHLSELALGGTAVGTGINTPPGYDVSVAAEIANLTGLPFRTAENKFESLAAHDAIVEAHGALKTVAVSLMKIANDIRMLSSGPRSGIGEIHIPDNEPGSSIMPGKVNPVIPEVVNQVAFEVIGADMTVTMAAEAGQLQLNAFEPVIIHSLLRSMALLSNACDTLTQFCVVGITANRECLESNIERSISLVTALNPFIGYKQGDKYSVIGADGGLDTLISRGTIVLACNNALGGMIYQLSQKEKISRDEARKQVLATLVPGVYVMPTGVFAIAAAQDAGCSCCVVR